MSNKACIRLKNGANESTKDKFVEAIECLTEMFEAGLRPQYGPQEGRVHPISGVGWESTQKNIFWFAIHDNYYSTYFKRLARLEMERRLVGDRYEVIVTSELS